MNNLTTLPCALLLRCPKLQTLMATYNSIEGLSDEIPLLQLNNVYAIDLSNNKLTSFGQLRFMKSLSTLNVESNELRQVPPELSQIKNLKFLAISQNPQRWVPCATASRQKNCLMTAYTADERNSYCSTCTL